MWLRKCIIILLCFFSNLAFATTFHDLQGHVVSMSQLKNKWVIINYWADWCHTCSNEVPELNRFYQNNRSKNVVFYGVNYDQLATPELKLAVEKFNINFPILQEDPNDVWGLGRIAAVPMTFIINPKGEVVKSFVGAVTEKTLADELKSLKNTES